MEGGGGGGWRGEEEKGSFRLSPPHPLYSIYLFIYFFCSCPNFLYELARKRLLPRVVTQSVRSRRSYGKIGDCEPSTTTTTS